MLISRHLFIFQSAIKPLYKCVAIDEIKQPKNRLNLHQDINNHIVHCDIVRFQEEGRPVCSVYG